MRSIFLSQSFEKSLAKFVNKNPDLEDKIWKVLGLLEKDIFYRILHTHKLHGRFVSHYASTVAYDCRLIFRYDDRYIYPLFIGSHDEVY